MGVGPVGTVRHVVVKYALPAFPALAVQEATGTSVVTLTVQVVTV
jgi:hypothetical protein